HQDGFGTERSRLCRRKQGPGDTDGGGNPDGSLRVVCPCPALQQTYFDAKARHRRLHLRFLSCTRFFLVPSPSPCPCSGSFPLGMVITNTFNRPSASSTLPSPPKPSVMAQVDMLPRSPCPTR